MRRPSMLACLTLFPLGLVHAQGGGGVGTIPCDPCNFPGQCQPADPILSVENHSCEDHAKHDHSGLDLHTVELYKIKFSSANLAGTRIQSSWMESAMLYGVDFTGGELQQVDADGIVLMDADLSGALLVETTMRGSYSVRADFTGAQILVDFSSSTLSQAVFTAAVLSTTEGMADFSNADLTNAVGLGDAIGVARYSVCTNFSGTGFDPVTAGWILTDGAQLGESYCGPAQDNSTGKPAMIQARGCPGVLFNRLTLLAEQLPQNQFGYFLASMTQDFVTGPGGSQGDLCLGGTIGRFTSQVENSGVDGMIDAEVDLTDLPPPLQSTVLPGDTWNFQAWYRDMNPTTTSNFTDGVELTFK